MRCMGLGLIRWRCPFGMSILRRDRLRCRRSRCRLERNVCARAGVRFSGWMRFGRCSGSGRRWRRMGIRHRRWWGWPWRIMRGQGGRRQQRGGCLRRIGRGKILPSWRLPGCGVTVWRGFRRRGFPMGHHGLRCWRERDRSRLLRQVRGGRGWLGCVAWASGVRWRGCCLRGSCCWLLRNRGRHPVLIFRRKPLSRWPDL